jgi:outer membrane protein OmpA-like peptidoglycan-associated protein
MNDYQQLRQLLLAEEQQRLSQLEQRVNNLQMRSLDVASVLPQALSITPDIAALVNALQKPVEDCIKYTLKSAPQHISTPLEPLLVEPLRLEVADLVKKLRQVLQQHKAQLAALDNGLIQLEQSEQQQIQALNVKISQLEDELKDTEKRTIEISKSLPEAIRRASESENNKNDINQAELAESLREPVTRCIQQSISLDAKSLADTLFPIMGPAIRRSINEAIKEFLQSVNSAVENSLSLKGMLWRLEAMRTGRSFADVVLEKNLIYRVEQVFLIHKETGLLIQHLSQDGLDIQDSDAVSAMLTAIQDFIRDSFTAEGDLEKIELGRYTVWLDQSPYAVLACVIRGNPSYKLREVMRQSLEAIHARYARLLAVYAGDSTLLEPSRLILKRNLQMQELKKSPQKRLFSPILIIILILISLGLGIWLFSYIQRELHINKYIATLRNTEGLMLIEAQRQQGKLLIRGLRDPLAASPQRITEQFGLQSKVIHEWGSYQDLSYNFVLQRAIAAINPPNTVTVQLKQDRLYLTGQADSNWIEQVKLKQGLLAGISEINFANLSNNDQYWLDTQDKFKALIAALNAEPGLEVINSGRENEQYIIRGLRDPLATDPQIIAAQFPELKLSMDWNFYQALQPQFILARAKQALQPPTGVDINLTQGKLKITGIAPQTWLQNLELKRGLLPIAVDSNDLRNQQQYWLDTANQFQALVDELRRNPGLEILEYGIKNQRYTIYGLRDSLAIDPNIIVANYPAINPVMHWDYYQALQPQFILARAHQALQPNETVSLSLQNGKLSLRGHASTEWIEKALNIPIAGVSELDLSQLKNTDIWLWEQIAELLPNWVDVKFTLKNAKLYVTGLADLNMRNILESKLAYLPIEVEQNLRHAEQEELEFLLANYVHTLQLSPGILVNSVERENDRIIIRGLKEPLAVLPAQPELNIQFYWTAYLDLAQEFVMQRVLQILQPPASVELKLLADNLYIRGHAPDAWLQQLEYKAKLIPGINKLHTEQLISSDVVLLAELNSQLNLPAGIDLQVQKGVIYLSGTINQTMRKNLLQQLANLTQPIDITNLLDADTQRQQQLIAEIESSIIYFRNNESIDMQQELQQLARQIKEFLRLNQKLKQYFRIQITGYTDGLGNLEYNRRLGQQRVEAVRDALEQHGIATQHLVLTQSSLIRFGETVANLQDRKVSFAVID